MPDVLACALAWLARREYAAHELAVRLDARGYDRQEIAGALASLQARGLQSDARYAEMLCHARMRQGYGPVRIASELKAWHIADALAESLLSDAACDWEAQARRANEKKFGLPGAHPLSPEQWRKQQRFLMYRGFPSGVVNRVLKGPADVVTS